jgi:hypothetical protein
LIKTVRVRPLPSFLWLAASFLGEAKPTAPQKTTPNATTKARRTHTLLLLNATCVPLSKGEGEAHRPRRVLCTTRSKHKRSRDPAPRAYGVNRTTRNPQHHARILGVAPNPVALPCGPWPKRGRRLRRSRAKRGPAREAILAGLRVDGADRRACHVGQRRACYRELLRILLLGTWVNKLPADVSGSAGWHHA